MAEDMRSLAAIAETTPDLGMDASHGPGLKVLAGVVGLAAVFGAGGASTANARDFPLLPGTEGATPRGVVDGKVFNFPVNPDGFGLEAVQSADCIDDDGLSSVSSWTGIKPSATNPGTKAVVTINRSDITECDKYQQRNIKKIGLETRKPGQERWRVSQNPIEDVTTNTGREGWKITLDYGKRQRLRRGQKLFAKLVVITENQTMVANDPNGHEFLELNGPAEYVFSRNRTVRRKVGSS